MALFESYERREAKILAVLKEYGIDSIEGAAEVTKAAGLDVYKMVGHSADLLRKRKVGIHRWCCHRNQEGLPQSC